MSAALTVLLADTFALYIKTNNIHWYMSGPHFRDYHLMLGDQATQLYALTDAIAEPVRKLGGTTIRSIGDIAIAGGLLNVVALGGGAWSLDARR